ncbi:MAG: thiamine phosphate synthase [Pseudomonadota bacterium]
MSDVAPSDLPSKLTLATPPQFELSEFSTLLEAIYDAVDVSCLRLSLATRDEDQLCRAADVLRALSHARDIPVLLDDHYRLVAQTGLDGVHLTDGPRRVREVRKLLGADAIVGTYCGTSRHNGLTAGEAGSDYIAFGPVTSSDLLGDGDPVDPEVFAWWSEMIELPVVAEGGLTAEILTELAPSCDFVCLSDEIWSADDGPVAAVKRLAALL